MFFLLKKELYSRALQYLKEMDICDISLGEEWDTEQQFPENELTTEALCEEQQISEERIDSERRNSDRQSSFTSLFLQWPDDSRTFNEDHGSLISTDCNDQERPSIRRIERTCALFDLSSNVEAKRALKKLQKHENNYLGANLFYKLRVAKYLFIENYGDLSFMIRPALEGFREYKTIDLREPNKSWSGNARTRPCGNRRGSFRQPEWSYYPRSTSNVRRPRHTNRWYPT